MRRSWFESVHEHCHNAISLFTGRQSPGSQSQPQSDPPAQSQSVPLAITESNASRSTVGRAAMPSAPFTGNRPMTRRITSFLNDHDSSERDPISLESDEERGQSPVHKQKKHPSPPTANTAALGTRLKRLETRGDAREEARLLGGVTRSGRNSGAVVIEDPMKKQSFTQHRGFRPVNNLDAPRQTPRSAEILARTNGQREGRKSNAGTLSLSHIAIPRSNRTTAKNPPSSTSNFSIDLRENNHDIPSKRQKLAHLGGKGSTSSSPIALDDSQIIPASPESPDELQLSTPPRPERKSLRLSTNDVQNRPGEPTDLSQIPSPSSDDEGNFTRESARRRKFDKDTILGSSSEASHNTMPTTRTFTSPYFADSSTTSGTGHGIPKLDTSATQAFSSPDALQDQSAKAVPESATETPMHALSNRDLSSMIAGNEDLRRISRPTVGTLKKKPQPRGGILSFNLEEAVYPELLISNIYCVEIDRAEKKFSINTQEHNLGDRPVAGPFFANKIARLRVGSSPIVMVMLSREQSQLVHQLHLKFVSKRQAHDFVNRLIQLVPSLTVCERKPEWLEECLKLARTNISDLNGRSLLTEELEAEDLMPGSAKAQASGANARQKRTRLVDKLDNPTQSTNQKLATSNSGPVDTSIHAAIPPRQLDSLNLLDDSAGIAEQVGTKRRQTRSQDVAHRVSPTRSLQDSPPRMRFSETGKLGKPWVRDLVYPKPGKRSATVPFEDLSRLDDDEFLNDNLIMFFVQYLETYMEQHNPELHKRTYFFNTYFFERLTKDVGRRQINYDPVSRWTKAIDLFSRDFVVVPVNENLHWYLAIICNLPYLRNPARREAEVSVDEGLGIEEQDSNFQQDKAELGTEDRPEVVSDLPSDVQDQLLLRENETQQSLAELSLNDVELRNITAIQSELKRGRGRPSKSNSKNNHKHARRSLPKYEPDKPIIITLDSLGLSRYGTCSALKQYIVAEAKDKRNLDVSVTDIAGMTAKEIPTQNNFSDCGLYLCMYLEQFVADPYKFISRILQRQEDAQGWPKRVQSESLRSRLRTLIMETHRRQENEESKDEIPKVGSIMVDTRSELPTVLKPRTKQDIEDAKRRFSDFTDGRAEILSGSKATAKEVIHNPPTSVHSEPADPSIGDNSIHGDVSSAPSSEDPDTSIQLLCDGDRGAVQSLSHHSSGGAEHASISDSAGSDAESVQDESNKHGLEQGLRHTQAPTDSSKSVQRPSASSNQTQNQSCSHNSPAELAAQLRSQHEARKRKRSPDDLSHSPRVIMRDPGFLAGIEGWAGDSPGGRSKQNGQFSGVTDEAEEPVVEVHASPDLEPVELSPPRKRKRKAPLTGHDAQSIEPEELESRALATPEGESLHGSGNRTFKFTTKKNPPNDSTPLRHSRPKRTSHVDESETFEGFDSDKGTKDDDDDMLLK